MASIISIEIPDVSDMVGYACLFVDMRAKTLNFTMILLGDEVVFFYIIYKFVDTLNLSKL